MDRKHFASTSRLRINDHVVELGDIIWQIRNLVAIAITRKTMPFNEPEPQFRMASPRRWPDWRLSAFLLALGGVAAWTISNSGWGALIGAASASGLLLLFARNRFRDESAAWNAAHEAFLQKRNEWLYRKNNPPVLFGLVLETAASSRSILHSYDESQLRQAHRAIREAMESKGGGDTFVSIDTVNMGGESAINNFESTIEQQTMEART